MIFLIRNWANSCLLFVLWHLGEIIAHYTLIYIVRDNCDMKQITLNSAKDIYKEEPWFYISY